MNLQINDLILTSIELFLNINMKKNKDFQSNNTNSYDKSSNEMIGHDAQLFQKPIQVKQPQNQDRFPNIFRFADTKDVILMIFGTIGSVLVGVFFVISFLFQGNMINNFQLPKNQLIENMVIRFYYFLGTGTIQLIGGFLMYFGWIIAGYRQAQKCRAQYLSAIFRQQIGWFETQDQSKIFTQFASDCDTFQQAINQKMAVCLFLLSSFAARIIVTLIVVWQLSLVLIGLIIVIVIVFTVTALIDQKYTQEVQKKSIDATARSEQALSCIQTVKALNGQQFQSCKYDKFLQMVQQNQFKLRLSNGVSSGIMFFVIYCLFSLGNFYGLHLISVQATSTYSATGFISIGDIFVVIFVLGIGVFITLQFKATLKKITDGIRAFNRIKSVIDRKKLQNQPQGIVPNAFYGHFLLENVSFCYPSQPQHKVLDNLTIDFNKQKHALVGFSGSGKSTIFQLLIRLYEPSSGKIYLDGVDIKQINVKWLRKNIGYVTQQSFFFTGTLRQNMLVSNPTASDSQIYDALKAAEIFETVQALQEKLDTKIFSNANQFSGGQRQRLSIAKALLRKPKILLLDEPTSSLDRKTETQIQKNLDQITVQMKSISIAHRISTIKNSDKIIFMKNGRVVQQGKLQQLAQFNAQVSKIKNNLVLHRNSSIFQQLKQFQNNSPQISLELSRRFSEEPVLSQIMIQQQYQQETIEQQNQGNQENQDKKQGQQKKLQKQYSGSVYFRIFRLSNKKFPFLIIAFILCVPIGMAPSFVGRQMGILITAGIELQGEALRQVSNYSSLIIFVIGTSFFIVKFFQSFLFSLCGSEITVQLRKRVFKKILNMPVCWFAEKDNSVTNLTQFLDKDCQQIQNLVTVSLGIMIQVLVVSLTSLTISFIYEYRVSFVVLAIIPPTVLINLLQVKINGSLAKQVEDIDKDSNSLLRQSMVNAKIILSNCFEDLVIRKYKQNIYAPLNSIIKKGIYSGLLYGISVFILIVVVGTQYIVMAAVLIQDPNIQIVNVIVPIFAMNICFIFITYLFHFMPDIGLAKRSAIKAFTILDLQDQQQMQRRQNSKMMQLNPQQFQQISLNNVTFRYPNRKQNVLEKASLTIFKGNQYNVIGRSGCGKSTLFKLLLRFYEPSEDSEIKINGVNIKQYDIKSLRNHFGLVSQQPMLFSGTIRQNITYNTKQKELKDIQQAAILSNALEFIKGQNMNSKHLSGKVLMVYGKNALKKDEEQVNQGYEKQVGVKGNQLSGGQRQRIAIARVLLRNPDFFLFDESTSALDHQTQSIVQSNFKQILKGKTSLNITHNFKQHQGKSIILIEDKNFGVINPIKKRE